MSDQNGGQMIQVPNTLRAKLGGKLRALDPAAIAKAEEALKNLSSNFGQWLQDEITKLDEARQRVRVEGKTPAAMEGLYIRAHDLKGLGATYGFPLITRIAASLCLLLDDTAKRDAAPLSLIDAHIDAIAAAVRDDIRDDVHPVGRALATELEAAVAAAL